MKLELEILPMQSDEPADSWLGGGSCGEFGGGIQELSLPGGAAVFGNFDEAAARDAIEHIGIWRRDYGFGIALVGWFCF